MATQGEEESKLPESGISRVDCMDDKGVEKFAKKIRLWMMKQSKLSVDSGNASTGPTLTSTFQLNERQSIHCLVCADRWGSNASKSRFPVGCAETLTGVKKFGKG